MALASLAGRFVSRDPTQDEDLARVVGGPDRLLEDLAGVDPAARPPLPHELPVQRRGVLADDEERLATGDPEEEVRRAEVAILDPEIAGADDFQDLVQQRTLLGMAVFAEDHVGGQHQPRVEHDQGLPRQGPGADRPQFLEPVLGPGQVVAVEDLDVIARQQRGSGAVHRVDDRAEASGGGVDQRRGEGRFGAVELAVDGLD